MRKMTCPKCGILVELKPENIDRFNLYTCKCGCVSSTNVTYYQRETPKAIEQ